MKKVDHATYHAFLVLRRETPDFRLLTRAQRGNFIPLLWWARVLPQACCLWDHVRYGDFKESAPRKENVVFQYKVFPVGQYVWQHTYDINRLPSSNVYVTHILQELRHIVESSPNINNNLLPRLITITYHVNMNRKLISIINYWFKTPNKQYFGVIIICVCVNWDVIYVRCKCVCMCILIHFLNTNYFNPKYRNLLI